MRDDSPWVVTALALEDARCAAPAQDLRTPLPYLVEDDRHALDVILEVRVRANANANASGGGGRPALASATNGQPRWDALFHSGADEFAPTRAAFKMRVSERLTTDLGASMLSARADDELRARAKEDEKSATTKELVDCARAMRISSDGESPRTVRRATRQLAREIAAAQGMA